MPCSPHCCCQAKWERVKGLPAALGDGKVVSNMSFGTAPKTFQALQNLQEGHALFTFPPGVVKCPGAGQKVRFCLHFCSV